jgi:hypothetical protein
MAATLILMAALWMVPAQGQVEPTAPRSTTERPNVSAPGMEQTLHGVLMDATCSAIADSRSDLTQTPRIFPRDTDASRTRSSERGASERAASESEIPERYRNCKVKASTTSFALYANGRVYMLDRVSNQMMQEHMTKSKRPDASSSRWMTRTLVGTPTSDDVLTLRSIRK